MPALECLQVKELRASLAHQASLGQQQAARIQQLESLVGSSQIAAQGPAGEPCQLALQAAAQPQLLNATNQGESYEHATCLVM